MSEQFVAAPNHDPGSADETTTDQVMIFSASRIAEIMTEPGQSALLPTPEQTLVIEHPMHGTALVVAGAGSGKTETMANRVVWLVANGLAEPSQILGLTFTRKAAGELNERIAQRLLTFAERVNDLAELRQLTPEESRRAAELHLLLNDGLDLPQVSTYNAFASGVLQEFGPLAGVAAGVTLLDDANAWRIARAVVCASTHPDLASTGDSIAQTVSRVLSLDHAISDNLTSFHQVEHFLDQFERIDALPYDEKNQSHEKKYSLTNELLENVRRTRVALSLAEQYSSEKQRLGVIEFSDQLSLAVRTIQKFPQSIQTLRLRTPVILLDEVQDTSVGQTALLSTLFNGCAVMAVGDPHQSIYGFRGASADNLRSFHQDFAGDQRHGLSSTLHLSVSWRNPSEVLHVANALVAPLAHDAPIPVAQLRSKESYLQREHGAAITPPDKDTVQWVYPETFEAEYEQIAQWFARERHLHLTKTGKTPSGAVVMRARRDMPLVAEALQQQNIPAQIVGVGGLLSTPEITEIVSTLRCIWFADAGSDLIRLLSSARFRIGPADLQGLKRAARWFAQRDISQSLLPEVDRQQSTPLPDPEREFTLIDTLDALGSLKSADHQALAGMSETGFHRLREAAIMLRRLRQMVSRDIPALIRAVEYELRIDIELEANERSLYAGHASARANIDAFTELVEGFLQTAESPSLALVLSWLERLTQLDQHAEHVAEPVDGAVQIITVHGSKGLEWDLVAVPRLVTDEFPAKASEGIGWMRPGQLPDELRGDAAARPPLHWRIATTQAELRERILGADKKVDGEKIRIPGYTDALVQRHAEEERRLAYVAVTRAAKRLLLSGSFWGRGKTARHPSVFLTDLTEIGTVSNLPEGSVHEENPRNDTPRTLDWPLDPLGSRTATVLNAAVTVRTKLESSETTSDAEPRVDPIVELILAEHMAHTHKSSDIAPLAERITASTFHEFIEDAEAAERKRNRPIPMQPFRKTRTGNQFHEWVERRSTTAVGTALQLGDEDPFLSEQVQDEEQATTDLQQLIANFESSRWADRQPEAVELQVSMPFAGRQLVCKLDAVFRETIDGVTTFEVVDWKTGRAPVTASERDLRFLQLELYRHAYAQWSGVELENIHVSLFYVSENIELTSQEPRTLEELEQLWLQSAKNL